MTLSEWDDKVRPHLHFIESGAEMAARHASKLPCRAQWATIAEDELIAARTVLENALRDIIAAQQQCETKPVERSDA